LNSLILVEGKRRYGKTIWVQWLLFNLWQYFPSEGYVFTGTKHNYFWQQHFPENRIYEGLNVEVLQSILNEQQDKVEAARKNDVDITESYWIVVIMEDLAAKEAIKHQNILKKAAFNGRHFNIM